MVNRMSSFSQKVATFPDSSSNCKLSNYMSVIHIQFGDCFSSTEISSYFSSTDFRFQSMKIVKSSTAVALFPALLAGAKTNISDVRKKV